MVESFWSEPSWHKRQQYNARWLLVQQGRTDGFLSSGSKSARGQRRHFFLLPEPIYNCIVGALHFSSSSSPSHSPSWWFFFAAVRSGDKQLFIFENRLRTTLDDYNGMELPADSTQLMRGRKYLNSSENMCRLPLERPMGFHAVVMERRAKTGRERESWSIIRRQSGRARRRVWGERQLFQMLGIKRREPTERDERAPGSQFSLGKRRRRRVANSGGSSSIPF